MAAEVERAGPESVTIAESLAVTLNPDAELAAGSCPDRLARLPDAVRTDFRFAEVAWLMGRPGKALLFGSK
jgi:hypothetical protein